MLRKTRSHMVAFSGDHAGQYPLTWAQAQILQWAHANGLNLNVTRWGGVGDGRSIADVLDAIRLAVERYEALRTRYVSDENGALRQVVADRGRLSVDEYSCDAREATAAMHDVSSLLGLQVFRPDDWPMRVAVITVSGKPTGISLSLHHGSADGVGATIVRDEIIRLCGGEEYHPAVAQQPREISAFETSLSQQQHATRSAAYYKTLLERLAPQVPEDEHVGTPFYRKWQLDSSIVTASAHTLAGRFKTSVPAVLVSAYAMSLGTWLNRSSVALVLANHNRVRSVWQKSVAHLAQPSILVVDLKGKSFGDICRNTFADSLRMMRYGRYDSALLAETRRRLEEECGTRFLFPYRVNIQLMDSDIPFSEEREQRRGDLDGQSDAASTPSVYQYDPGKSLHPDGLLKFDVWKFYGGSSITLGSDSSRHSEDGLLEILQGFEGVLGRAADAL
jgi:hypothetical protein